jgi:hypothetical protein
VVVDREEPVALDIDRNICLSVGRRARTEGNEVIRVLEGC